MKEHNQQEFIRRDYNISITSISMRMNSNSKTDKISAKNYINITYGLYSAKQNLPTHEFPLKKQASMPQKQQQKNITSQDIPSACIDVLNAMLCQTQKDADKCINKIESKHLKEKFLEFKNDYYYKAFRQGNLKFKVIELNDFFKSIASSKELILPTIKLKSDEIKELDYHSLHKVIKMTNQSKVFYQIMKKEEVKLNIDYLNTESLVYFNSLIKMQGENGQGVKTLRARYDQLQSDYRILRYKFNKKSLQNQKEQKESVNLELANNRELITKLKADVDRLTKENERLSEQSIKLPSYFQENLNYKRNAAEDQRQRAKRMREVKGQLQRQNQQKLTQKQRTIKELTDNSIVTKLLLDQAKVDRDQAKGILKAVQIQFQDLNQKYQKIMKQAEQNKEKEQKYEKQRLAQAQANIINSTEIHRLANQLRSKDQQLLKALKKLQQRQKSESEEKNKQNHLLIESQKAAMLKYKHLKQEKERNQRTLEESARFLRNQLQEKSATLIANEEELRNTKISLDTLRKDHEKVIKQFDELKERRIYDQETNRIYEGRMNSLESYVENLKSTIKENEENLDKEKTLSKQLSNNLNQILKENELIKKQLAYFQTRQEKQDSISAQKQQQDEQYNILKETVRQKEEQIVRLNASVKDIKRQLQSSSAAATRLEARLSAVNDQKEQIQQQINEKDIRISELSANIRQFQLALEQNERKNRKLETDVAQSQRKNKKLQKDIQQVNDQNIHYLLTIQNVQDQNKNLESKCNVLEKQLKTLQIPPEQKEEERFEVLYQQSETKPKIEENNHQHERQKQYLLQQIQQKSAQLQKANEECRKIQEELQSLRHQYSIEVARRQQLQNIARDLQNSVKDTQQQLKDKNQVLTDVLKQLEQHKERDQIRMDKQLDAMREAKDKQYIVKSLQNELQSQKQLLAAKNAELQMQKQSYLKEQKAIRDRLDIAQTKNQELIERIELIVKEKDSLATKTAEQLAAYQEEENKQKYILQTQLDNFRRNIQQSQQILRQKDEELEKLRTELQQSNKTIISYKQKQGQTSTIIAQISDLSRKLQKLQAENEQLSLSLKLSQSQNNTKKIKINNLQDENENFKKTLNKMNDQLDNSKRHIKDIVKEQENVLDKERKKHSLETQKEREEVDLLTKKNKQLEELFEKLTESNEKLEVQLAHKTSQLQSEKSASSKLRHEIAEFYTEKKKSALTSDERTKFQKRIKSYEEEISDLNHQLEVLHQSIEDMNYMNRSFQNRSEVEAPSRESIQKISALEAEIAKRDEYITKQSAKWREEKSMLDTKNNECQAQIDELKEKNKALEDSCQASTQQTQAIKLEMTKISMTLDLKIKQFSTLQQSHDLLIAQQKDYIRQTEKDRQNYEKQLNQVKKHCQQILRSKDLSASLLFQNDLLQFELQYKIFLKQAIQTHMRFDIAKTRLIYRFDPMNKTNFHKYFDGKDNIVIIIKTIYGSYLAAYSQGPFAPKRVSDRDGLIIALNRKEVFTLSQNCTRAITYDDYYLIFGNSEIRLRSQEQKVFSNFAISNGYYATRGKKVMDLLGGGPSEREVDIEGYEIYQLEFVY